MTLRFFAVLLLLTLGLTVPGRAQQTVAPALTPDQYCVLIATGNHYASLSLRLEYGQLALQPEAVKVKSQASLAGALNYLSSLGWELVASNMIPMSVGVTKAGYSDGLCNSEQQYILRRRR